MVNFRHKYHHNRSEKWFKWFKNFIDVQIRLVKVYFNIPSVQILRDSIFINRRRFLNATFRIETIFRSKNVVCFKKKAHTSFIMKVTSFYSQQSYPKTIILPVNSHPFSHVQYHLCLKKYYCTVFLFYKLVTTHLRI